MSKSYYEILEIHTTASKEEIKVSFRQLVRKFHPDINKSPEAEMTFKKINEAFETLGDDVKRAKYNFSIGIKESFEKEVRAKETKATDHENSQKSNVKADFSQKENSKNPHNTNFGEILHHFFEDKKGERAPKVKKINGDNILMTLELTGKEALEGTTKKVNIVHSELCPKCGGKKFINGAKCTICDGTGEKTIHKKVSIAIPKNPKNGSVIKIAHEGKPGKFGGKSGDLIITIKIKQLEIFKIEKGIATVVIPITPPEALLGCEIRIPTLGGTTMMKIPPQTNSGQQFNILNAGIMNPKTGVRGDLIVTVKIDVPQKPTLAELKLYRELMNMDSSEVRKELLLD